MQARRLHLLGRGAVLGLGRLGQRPRGIELRTRRVLALVEVSRAIVVGIGIAPLGLGAREPGARLVESYLEIRTVERRDEIAPLDLVTDVNRSLCQRAADAEYVRASDAPCATTCM